MSKTKIWLIISAVLVIFGLIVFVGVMAVYDFDFAKLSTEKYTTNTYEVSGDFNKIAIDVDTTDVEFAVSKEGQCKIVCTETEKVKHSAGVQNGSLLINIVDTRKWYDYIGIFNGDYKMTVYLPQENYESIIIDTHTGDISIPDTITLYNLKIDGDTSDVECFAPVSNCMEIELSTGNITAENFTTGEIDFSTSTGDINIIGVAVGGNIDIETDTGAVKLINVSCKDFSSESDTGDIRLKNTVATGKLLIETDTGDVNFENSDAKELLVKTDTGDVRGNLLTEKIFITETSTGNVNVPKSTTGGKCEIVTSTGDISIVV